MKYGHKMDLITAENTAISGPLKLASYYVVAPYSDPKTKLNLLLGSTVQVVQKEASGERLDSLYLGWTVVGGNHVYVTYGFLIWKGTKTHTRCGFCLKFI